MSAWAVMGLHASRSRSDDVGNDDSGPDDVIPSDVIDDERLRHRVGAVLVGANEVRSKRLMPVGEDIQIRPPYCAELPRCGELRHVLGLAAVDPGGTAFDRDAA